MIRNVIALPTAATVLDACEFFTMHRLLAFPIVDEDRKLIGVIDVELYTDELTGELGEEGERSRVGDDVFELIGVHLTEAQQASPVRSFAGRFPWLLCNIGGGILAAILAGFFDDVLTLRGAVYALFIPVVLALSESVAMQSVTLTVSRLRSGNVPGRVLIRRGLIEGATGLFLGIASAVLLAVVAGFWLRDASVAVTLIGAVALGVMLSAVVGYAVPSLLHRFQWNPNLAAGPISLATADMLTLLIYFNLGRALG
jgi:magnesium transporter